MRQAKSSVCYGRAILKFDTLLISPNIIFYIVLRLNCIFATHWFN